MINKNQSVDLIVVDDFYENPFEIREQALRMPFMGDDRYFKGQRSSGKYLTDEIGRAFEKHLNKVITKWDYPVNGCFQFCTPQDLIVYHMDAQQYAATVYLTPDAPIECGTSFYRSKKNKINKCPTRYGVRNDEADRLISEAFSGGFYDKTNFELVDTVGNIFNRLVIWDAKMIHAASQYFGTKKEDARLFQMFFFDAE